MSIYTTMITIAFQSEQNKNDFINDIDRAEGLGTQTDYGPAWIGNIIQLYQEDPVEQLDEYRGIVTKVMTSRLEVLVMTESEFDNIYQPFIPLAIKHKGKLTKVSRYVK